MSGQADTPARPRRGFVSLHVRLIIALALATAVGVALLPLWGELAALAAGVALGAALVLFFTRPLRELARAAGTFPSGDIAPPLAVAADELGEVARALGAAQRRLTEAKQQLARAERLAAFGTLGAGITHEVKNPITALVGFAQLAQKKIDNPEKVLELLKIIETEGLRCRDILSNFLKFARGAGRGRGLVQLNQVVRETARVLHHQLGINGVQLELSLSEGVPEVVANSSELQQVLVNLAINAQQAMPRGGRVTITTAKADDGSALLSVADDGPGIPEDVRQHLFEPFFSTKVPGEGTGLGLAISDNIIKAYGGVLSVASTVGQGAVFTARLPPAPAEEILGPSMRELKEASPATSTPLAPASALGEPVAAGDGNFAEASLMSSVVSSPGGAADGGAASDGVSSGVGEPSREPARAADDPFGSAQR
jgi:signal transduction histidine kinase